MASPTAAELAGSTLLESLSPGELQAAAALFNARSYPQGAILVAEGGAGDRRRRRARAAVLSAGDVL